MNLVCYGFSNTCCFQNLTRMTGTLLLALCTFVVTISLNPFQNQIWFRKEFVEKIKTHIFQAH